MIDLDANCLAPVMAVFGQSVVYRAGASLGASSPMYFITITDAIFDEAYIDIRTLSDESIVSSVAPVLGVRASWFVYRGKPFAPKQMDEVDISGGGTGTTDNLLAAPVTRRYRVTNAEPDNHGHILLRLTKIGEWNGVGS